jgi:hypothetical protein
MSHAAGVSVRRMRVRLSLVCSVVVEHQTERNAVYGAHSRVGAGINVVSIKIAQAVIVEAELHRRRFPNLACGGSRVHST